MTLGAAGYDIVEWVVKTNLHSFFLRNDEAQTRLDAYVLRRGWWKLRNVDSRSNANRTKGSGKMFADRVSRQGEREGENSFKKDRRRERRGRQESRPGDSDVEAVRNASPPKTTPDPFFSRPATRWISAF